MLKIIGGLSLLLIISLSFNYAQFQKAKAKDLVIQTYTQANKELNIEKDKLTKDKQSLQDSYDNVLSAVKQSDASFEELTNKLGELNCSKEKVNHAPKTTPTKAIPVDTSVAKYYDILRTAYSLQNKN